MRKCRQMQNYIKSLIVSLCLLLTGCGTIGLAQEATFESAYENVPEEEPVDIFTSAACGVVEAVDTENSTVTFYLVDRKEQRTFSYDAATLVQDRHGSALTMAQLTLGEVVDIAYNDELSKMGSVVYSMDGFSYDSISNYVLDEGKGTVQIGSDIFGMGNGIKVFSGNEQMELSQILKHDIVSFRGVGSEVVSIIVDKGHGYLKLENDEALIGGWVEVGQTVIQQISDNMLITVPEGSYTVRLTANDIEEYREITVERNKETVIDLGDIEVKKPVNGAVTIQVTPEDAEVYIDDMLVNASYQMRIPLGIHKITAKAEGYDAFSEYFEVTEETTAVKMTLKEASTVSGNASKKTAYTMTVQAPENVEIYQDNLYIGITPVTYEKSPGTHTITLRKSGYETRSYQIMVADDDKDAIYSFPDLVIEGATSQTVSGNNSISGNSANTVGNQTVSGNTLGEASEGQTVSGNALSDQTVSGNN